MDPGHQSNLSSSSAIDLTGTPTGLASRPASPSPSQDTLDTPNAFSRRRTSWGRNDTRQDPLNTSAERAPTLNTLDDPFDDEPQSSFYRNGARAALMGYATEQEQAGLSTASLIGPHEMMVDGDGTRDDDEAHLTANMPHVEREHDRHADLEQSAGSTPRRQRTTRYSPSPSPLKKTGTAIKTVSRNLRRMSLRVVNIAGAGLENQIRLYDGDEEGKRRAVQQQQEDDEDDGESLKSLHSHLPLRGRTLGFMGPENSVRLGLYRFLIYPWTEPIILLLIFVNAIILTIQAFPSLTLSGPNAAPPRESGYFHSWEDYALFVLFIIYTIEAFARICVSGFLLDPEIPIFRLFASPFRPHIDPPLNTNAPSNSSVGRQGSLLRPQGPLSRGLSLTQRIHRFNDNLRRPFFLSTQAPTTSLAPPSSDDPVPVNEKLKNAVDIVHAAVRDQPNSAFLSNALRSDRPDVIKLPFQLSIVRAHHKTHRNIPYLRHSWSRIDFVAIISFWISFALATGGLERGAQHIGIFRAMSVIRTARLLTVTSGTTTIMHSLKTARPLLASVAYFVLFAMVLFSIIGVQSFKGSMRRACYLSPTLGEDEMQLENQFCGGYIDPTSMNVTSYIQLDGQHAPKPKGYICPLGQVCREKGNPNQEVESFDTIYNSALQVIIIASANGWSPLMYSMIDSEFFVSCTFFIVCVIILNFWLINLFVAVITNTFSAIRSETKKSAFGAAPLGPAMADDDEWSMADGRRVPRKNLAKTLYSYVEYVWVILALASLGLQASRTLDMPDWHEDLLTYGELVITIAFDIEIVIRFLAVLPDWRSFHKKGRNVLDTFLAVGCTIIQIPAIRNSEAYPWLTIIQLMRFYRVILVVPRMRPLLMAVFGNMYGMLNMSLFLILINYVAALMAVQLLRGDVHKEETINFGHVYNAFLGVYQVFSSENWIDILYGATEAATPVGQTVVVTLFITAWMLFANFILLQMFIAVINENFDVAEEAKKGQQASSYWAKQHQEEAKTKWIRYLNPYNYMKAAPATVQVENLPSNLVLPIQRALVQDYGIPNSARRNASIRSATRAARGARHYTSKSLSALRQLFGGDIRSNDVPLANLRHARTETLTTADPHDEEIERHLELLASVNQDVGAEDINDARQEVLMQRADFIRDHPTYDRTFWLLSQKNPLRRFCQSLVEPAAGPRIFGRQPSAIGQPIFQLLLFLAVVGGIAVEAKATPLYRRNFYLEGGLRRGAWFDMAEAAFGLTLLTEFLIKIIADGFLFTPNAYVRSIWNILDFVILAGLLINMTTTLIFIGGLSRLTRSLKALRALRLITLIGKMRETFESLIISGALRIMDAAILAILYMIPYAVWGLNIFAGKMNQCNDGQAGTIAGCVNEFSHTAIGESFGFQVPRVWSNPSPSTTFSFDNFRSSLLILFEIVSLEGWIDVMGVAMSITGRNQQPQTNAAQLNAVFFVIYNLLGGVVIFTLFVSIIIGNFSSKTGAAFLTQPQREWIDLQKLFKRQRPSKRPRVRPISGLRAWCFDRAVQKHGWWSRLMTLLFIIHIIVLMTQTFTSQDVVDTLRNSFFLAITFVYIIDTSVRLFGLGWRSFRANGWNLFDIIISVGSFITSLVARFGTSEFVMQQLQKLFLVSIAFKLVQRTDSLNKLFKTAMASLPVILSLLGLWFIVFIFFAILFVEVFGMTKWSTAETRTQNYTDMGAALVMLAFMSTGEGWNQYMHDYAISFPRCTNSTATTDSDCGSVIWSFSLFIAWNLLSMYIFLNMFTGVVVESFSYVFQTSTGGAKSITRQQMRAFKKVWAECANERTGLLERSNFVRFFGKLSGVFEVKIYPTEYSVPNINRACKASPESENGWTSRLSHGVDLDKLDAVLSGIDYAAIRKRRLIYSRLYHEASISHRGGGISFTDMLMLLAHHKLIVDRDALVLKDLVIRSETNKLVTDLVNLDRVRSLLKTISYRRRFLAHLEEVRSTRMSQQEIPSIIVEGMPETPPMSTRDIASISGSESPSPSGSPWLSSPTHHDRRLFTPDISLALDSSVGPGLQRSSRRISDISLLSTTDVFRSRDSSPVGEDLFNSMQNSMWGDMMTEAAEEEGRH
ncbi:hypothetical protein HGRIS_010628 [Hohenbuehelia grisea]|uniref:Ion transport domain-containing protein n=1 Tax=Hohenbuehelia grisea TaxID=104357 RepID=A0ABR3IXH5_9AGAR